jgi:hypothetical protein
MKKTDQDRTSIQILTMVAGDRKSTLLDRITRAIEARRGIKFSAADVDELTAMGLYDVISSALAKELKEQALARISAREATKGKA